MQKVNILVIPSDHFGVGKFRSINPHVYLQNHYGNEFHVDIEMNPPDEDEYFKKYQIVHFHSFIHKNGDIKTIYESTLKRLKWCKENDIKTIVDIDDYWMPDQFHPLFHIIQQRKDNEFRVAILKASDWIMTTTPVFSDIIQTKLGLKNIIVIPNSIDPNEKQYQPNPEPSEKIRLGWLGGSCYDNETEILTENGFKLFKDLIPGEKVATLNNYTIEYNTPKKYIKVPFNGKLNCVKSRYIEYCVTPNHNMYVSTVSNLGRKKLNYQLISSDKIYNENLHFKRDGKWEGQEQEYFILPSYKDKPEIKILMDDWLKFFGFWIAEGWTTKGKNQGRQVGIAQYKENDYLEIIGNILLKYGFKPYINKKQPYQYRYCNVQFWSYLNQFGYACDKYIPMDILNLSSRQLEILLEWYIKGDGHIENNKYERKRAWTCSSKLADNLQEIALKVGYCANIMKRIKKTSIIKGRLITNVQPSYQISFSKHPSISKHTKLNPLVRKKEHFQKEYNDYVYCVEVKNHIIYVRKNGKAFWCGNSHQHDIELMRNGLSSTLYQYKDTVQLVLCGFDLRGQVTEINPQNGEQRKRDILPQETSWYEYERCFTDDYRILSEEYRTFLQTFKNEQYNDLNEPYRRVWTRHINSYAENYNKFDIALAPLKSTLFNSVKSNLKVVEAGFHKKPIICSNVAPYQIDIIHGVNGFLIDENKKHKQWFQCMKKLIDNPELAKEMGERLYETVKDKYSLETTTKTRRNFYMSLVGVLQPI